MKRKKTNSRSLAKPRRQATGKALNYREARDYINAKYKVDIDDYAGKWKKGAKADTPFQCFWHWFIDKGDIHNGCFAYLGFDWLKKKQLRALGQGGPDHVQEGVLAQRRRHHLLGGLVTNFWDVQVRLAGSVGAR